MRDRPFRTPRAPKLDWPGGIVPEWAKVPAAAQRRGKGGKGARGGKASARSERLQKVMAQSGHGSRRNIEILIAQGHITINGQVAKLGDLVGPGDRVKLDGKLINLRFGSQLPRVLLYHKPEGEICTRDDPEGRPTVFAKLPKVNNARWVSIGRLDFNTSGLLMFTTNGELANHLMHPRYEMEREYAVRLMGELTTDQVRLLTGEGIDIDGENCKFVRLVDRGGEGANHWYHVVLKEGKNREVRRMFEAVGIMVSRLMRVRYGPVELPGFLKRGMMRDMPEPDVVKLMDICGMNESSAEPQESDEEEDEASPGNVASKEELAAAEEEFADEYDEDDLQPAFLMEGYKPDGPDIVEEDDDRQPDFERLPGFNRATGTMGLPAGHRGYHPGQEPAQGQGQGAGGKKRRGKRRGKPGAPGAGAGPGGPFQAKGPGRGPQGQGHGKKRPFGKGPGNAGKGHRQGNVQAQGTVPQGQASDGGAQPQGKPPVPGAAGVPGQGKTSRRRRNRNRGRNRGGESQTPSGGSSSGGVPA
jgi:23S rRNA pseudouridine2605 synthase